MTDEAINTASGGPVSRDALIKMHMTLTREKSDYAAQYQRLREMMAQTEAQMQSNHGALTVVEKLMNGDGVTVQGIVPVENSGSGMATIRELRSGKKERRRRK